MATWTLNGTTATCKDAAANTTITVKDVKSIDGLSFDGTKVVVSNASLDAKDVTIACTQTSADGAAATTYTLALGTDIPKTVKTGATAAWTFDGTTATYGIDAVTNYKLDGGSIKYNDSVENPAGTFTYAKVTGLKSELTDATADDLAKALKVSGDNTITVNADAFDTTNKNSKVTLTNGTTAKTYTLAVDANVNKTTTAWKYSGEQATYQQSASFNFAANDAGTEIAAKNPTAKTVDLAVVSGLRKGITADINTLLKVEGNTITVDASVLGAKKITLTNKKDASGAECKFSFGSITGTYATGGKEETPAAWIISGSTAKYYSGKDSFDDVLAYKVSKDEISYTAPKAAKGAEPEITITNLVSGLVHDATGGIDGLTISGTTVAVSDDLFNKKTLTISGKNSRGVAYTFSSDSGVDSTLDGRVGYEVSNTSVKYTANLAEDSYTLSSSGKSILYSKNGGDTLLATISGVKKDFDQDESIIDENEHISFDGTTVTLGSAALGKGKVTIKGDGGFVLGLNTDASSEGYVTPAVTGESATWTVTKTKAEYGIATSEGYQLADDGSSIAPVKASVKAQATITGVNENLPAIAEKAVGTLEEYVRETYADEIDAEFDSGDYTDKDEVVAAYCNDKKAEYDAAIAAEIAKYIVVDSTKKTITLKPQAVGTAAIKLKIANGADDYDLALDKSVLQTEADTKKPANLDTTWTVSGTTATYQTYYPAYYVLSSSKAGFKDVKYNKAVPVNKTPDITISGLVKGLSVVDKAIDGITVNTTTKVVTLDKSVLGATNAKVTKGSYTLALGSGFDEDGTETRTDTSDDLSVATYKFDTYNSSKGSADLKLEKTVGYELSTDAKSINFIKKAENKKVITLTGIAKQPTVNEPTVDDNVTIENGVITIKDANLLNNVTAAKPLKVTGNGYSLALDIGVQEASFGEEWVIEKGKAILRRTYTNEGYAVSVDGKSVTEVDENSKPVDLLTITGLDSAITADDLNEDKLELDAKDAKYIYVGKDGVLTIQKDAVGTSAIKLNTKGSYTLALGDGIAQSATEAGSGEGWVVKGTAATYQTDIARGYYTLDAKGTSISFTAPKNTSTTGTVTVSGLKSGLKVNADGSITGLTKKNNKITLGSEVLGTSNITVSDNTYKLALDPEDDDIILSTKTYEPSWVLKGTNATYVQPQAKGYAYDGTNNTITYTKGGNDIVMATISGLSKNLADELDSSDTLSAKYVSVEGNVITLTDAILLEGTKSVKLKNGKQADGKTAATYTLAVDSDVATSGQKVQWYVKGTTAQYINCDVAHYKAKGDTQFDFVAAAPASGAKAQITLEGINNKTVTVDNDGKISNVSIVEKVVKLTEDALNKKTVKLTGDGYTLDVTGTTPDEDVYEDAAKLEATWKTSGTTAKLNQKQSKGYTLSNDKKTLSYLASSKEVTLATVKGLKSGQKLDDEIEGSETELTLAGEKLSTKVTVDGVGYSFTFENDFNGTYDSAKDKVTYATITGSKNIDSITVAGVGILVNAGKGDDYVDLVGTTRKLEGATGEIGNVLQFVSGDGDDTVANYKTGDTIKISNITAKNVEDGKYEVTTTVSGDDIVFSLNKKGKTADKDVIDTITLKGAKDQTVTVVDKSDATIYTTATASEFIGSGNVAEEFYSDNYIGSANDLGDIISGDATFSVGDIETSDATDLTKQNTTTIVASTGK